MSIATWDAHVVHLRCGQCTLAFSFIGGRLWQVCQDYAPFVWQVVHHKSNVVREPFLAQDDRFAESLGIELCVAAAMKLECYQRTGVRDRIIYWEAAQGCVGRRNIECRIAGVILCERDNGRR